MLAIRDYIARRWCGLCDWAGTADVRVWPDQAHTWICPSCGLESEDVEGEDRWFDRP